MQALHQSTATQRTLLSAPELVRTPIPEPRWAVAGLLPQGLVLLAGKPNSGKSWLALQLAAAVAAGRHALGSLPVFAGDVLYLALEDSPRRLRQRLIRLFGPAPAASPQWLTVANSWYALWDDGRYDLISWLNGHPNARLIVVDTLTRACRRDVHARGRRVDPYALLGSLKQLAEQYATTMLILYDARTVPARDPFAAAGDLAGVADTLLVLRREGGGKDILLHAAGRDLDERGLALGCDARSNALTVLGDARERLLSAAQAEVLEVLRKSELPMAPKEVAEILSKPYIPIKSLLWRMAEKGLLERFIGTYRLALPADKDGKGDEKAKTAVPLQLPNPQTAEPANPRTCEPREPANL